MGEEIGAMMQARLRYDFRCHFPLETMVPMSGSHAIALYHERMTSRNVA